jgi:hypothetical protein
MENFLTPPGTSSQPFNNESDYYYVHEITKMHQQQIPNPNQVVQHQPLPSVNRITLAIFVSFLITFGEIFLEYSWNIYEFFLKKYLKY